MSEEICAARCAERAKSSGRSDDKPDVILNRLRNYNEKSKPVVDLYDRFGKVCHIDGGREIGDVYADARCAMFPHVSCMIGPPESGTDVCSQVLNDRTGARPINFEDWLYE